MLLAKCVTGLVLCLVVEGIYAHAHTIEEFKLAALNLMECVAIRVVDKMLWFVGMWKRKCFLKQDLFLNLIDAGKWGTTHQHI